MSCFFALATWLICLRSAEVFATRDQKFAVGQAVGLLVLCQNRKLSRSQRHRFMSGKIHISCPQSGGGEAKARRSKETC